MPNRTGHVALSVVIPSFNEDAVIQETHRRLTTALGSISNVDFELVYVDDGSTDATLDVLRGVQRADERVRVVSLSRNFGHQVALTAGLAHASGDVVAVIDADLQDPPEAIVEMVDRWRAGADVAYGVRSSRQGESVSKRAFSRMFYRLLNRLSEVPVPLDTGDFRLMDRRVVDALLTMPERSRYVRGMVAWTGFRQEPVHFERAPRLAGETKYSIARMVRLATDGVLSFSVIPLRLATYLGFAASLLALAGIIYALVLRLLTDVWVTQSACVRVWIACPGLDCHPSIACEPRPDSRVQGGIPTLILDCAARRKPDRLSAIKTRNLRMLPNPTRSVLLKIVSVVLSVWIVQSAHSDGLTEQVRTYAMTVELRDREITMLRRVSWTRVEEAGQEAWRVSTEHESSDLPRSVDTIHLAAEYLRPLRRYISQGNKRVRLLYSDDAVRGNAWLEDGSAVPIEVALDEPTVGDVAAAMATLPIAPGYTTILSSFDPTLVSVRRWKIVAGEVEDLETPLGPMRTYPLEVSDANRPGGSGLYWVTEDYPHHVVRSESNLPDSFGGGLETVVLESVSPLTAKVDPEGDPIAP